jgi:rfaE bifunctional protein nucleotidyltransferase chain/domain
MIFSLRQGVSMGDMITDVNEKILSIQTLVAKVKQLKQQNKKIVFTNGCFDLFHVGHSRYLRDARKLGDYLIVAVNTDQSVSNLKGEIRPILPLEERMEVLASLYFVDFVISFDDPTPYQVIDAIKPNVLVKGGDWAIDKIVGKDIVEAEGGNVFSISVDCNCSTTAIIKKIIQSHSS